MNNILKRLTTLLVVVCFLTGSALSGDKKSDPAPNKSNSNNTTRTEVKTTTKSKLDHKDSKDESTTTHNAIIPIDSKAEIDQVYQSALDALRSGANSKAQMLTGEQILWQVIGSGGGTGTSTNYSVSGTIGQTAAGIGSSTNYDVSHGFWQEFIVGGGGCCVGMTGNVDDDAENIVDIGDLTALIDYLFISYTVPVCFEEANCDGEGTVDIGDLTALIDYLFISYTPPEPCL